MYGSFHNMTKVVTWNLLGYSNYSHCFINKFRCARVGKDSRIDLGACSPETYNLHQKEMLFEFDQHGFIKVASKVISVQACGIDTIFNRRD